MSGLTVWWEVDLAFGGEEGVDLALALELGGELLGGYLLAGDMHLLLLWDLIVVLLHCGLN